MGGSGVWEDTGPANHDGASKALPELLPAAVVHLQSSGPVSSRAPLCSLQQPPHSSHFTFRQSGVGN